MKKDWYGHAAKAVAAKRAVTAKVANEMAGKNGMKKKCEASDAPDLASESKPVSAATSSTSSAPEKYPSADSVEPPKRFSPAKAPTNPSTDDVCAICLDEIIVCPPCNEEVVVEGDDSKPRVGDMKNASAQKCAAGDELRTLSCGHRFHAKCIEESLKKSNICPYCRKPQPMTLISA